VELADAAAENVRMFEEVAASSNEKAALRERIAKLESNSRTVTLEIEDNLNRALTEEASLQDQLASVSKQASVDRRAFEEEIAILESKLRDQIIHSDRADDDVEGLRGKLNSTLTSAEKEKNALEAKLRSLERSLQQRDDEVEESRLKIQSLEDVGRALSEQVVDLSGQMGDVNHIRRNAEEDARVATMEASSIEKRANAKALMLDQKLQEAEQAERAAQDAARLLQDENQALRGEMGELNIDLDDAMRANAAHEAERNRIVRQMEHEVSSSVEYARLASEKERDMARLLVEEETTIIRELDLQMRAAKAKAGAEKIRSFFRRNLRECLSWGMRRWTLICVGSYVTRLRIGCEEAEELSRWKAEAQVVMERLEGAVTSLQRKVREVEAERDVATWREQDGVEAQAGLAQEIHSLAMEREDVEDGAIMRVQELTGLIEHMEEQKNMHFAVSIERFFSRLVVSRKARGMRRWASLVISKAVWRRRSTLLNGGHAVNRVFTRLSAGSIAGAFTVWKREVEMAVQRAEFAMKSLSSGATRMASVLLTMERDGLRRGFETWKSVATNLFLLNRNGMVRKAYGAASFGRVIRRMFLNSVKNCFAYWVHVVVSIVREKLHKMTGKGRESKMKSILQGWSHGALMSGFGAFKFLLHAREVRDLLSRYEDIMSQQRTKASHVVFRLLLAHQEKKTFMTYRTYVKRWHSSCWEDKLAFFEEKLNVETPTKWKY